MSSKPDAISTRNFIEASPLPSIVKDGAAQAGTWDGDSPAPIGGPAREPRTGGPNRRLSVLVPVYNEEEVLREFHRRLIGVLSQIELEAEVLYVDDGSSDASLQVLEDLHRSDSRVGIVSLSRNFGKEVAMAAGLDHVSGDAIVLIDADLQDPPELIPQMVEAWERGFEQVEMRRIDRAGESLLKRWTAQAFYRLIARVSDVSISVDVGDFRLLGRRVADDLRQINERNRFMKGLYAWVGHSRVQIGYRRSPRQAGRSKWNYWRLWNLAIEGVTSFSVMPLKLASYVGLLVAVSAFVYALIAMLNALMSAGPATGHPSLMTAVLFLGGAQLFCIGVIGEYLGRMFIETKRRPLYLVSRLYPAQDAGSRRTIEAAA